MGDRVRPVTIESAEEFRRLRTSEDPDEYRRAAHEEATEATWLQVIDLYPEMREWVALNKTVPLGVLDRLSLDGDERVRSTVASKRKLTPALVARLARDGQAGVRGAIACNRGRAVTVDVLTALSTDPDPVVSGEARRRLLELVRGD